MELPIGYDKKTNFISYNTSKKKGYLIVSYNQFVQTIARDLHLQNRQVAASVSLISEGATIPFVARYRKEATGNLDEVVLAAIRDTYEKLILVDKRRKAVLDSLIQQDKLTPELKGKIENAQTLPEIEDLYLPFRPKKKTLGSIAAGKGLLPLADLLSAQQKGDVTKMAAPFLDPAKGLNTVEEVLKGARDILSERINENNEVRKGLRALFSTSSFLSSKVKKGKETEGENYKDYFALREPVKKSPSYRILAVLRGEAEGFLSVSIGPEEEIAMEKLKRFLLKNSTPSAGQVETAALSGYKRLLKPSLENEIRKEIKLTADKHAISVFSRNLRQLLLAPPLGEKNILSLDPGLRTGCKVVSLNKHGDLMEAATIYPLPPHNREKEAENILKKLTDRYAPDAVAVGNGTGGRETYSFLKKLPFLHDIPVIMVNESGASVYSASKIAREEFPDQDITIRGAVSIGRRLMDPLSELVKIDAKAIGVGQYQHDVDQKLLKGALEEVVVSCVNSVGVELNTSSKELLRFVSGLSEKLASAITDYRKGNGPFKERASLLQVPGIGPKVFQQAAGFLRIKGGKNPLDQSGVHPESYPIVKKMAKELDISIENLTGNKELIDTIPLEKYITEKTGMPTLLDIAGELKRPGRDPRENFEPASYTDGIENLSDLKEGMLLTGVVTNITDFGAFVDIGVHQDGLVHISQLSNSFVHSPHDIVRIGQTVRVKILTVEKERRRIFLSIKEAE